MTETSFNSSTRLRRHLTIGYALFIVYASLTPFTGWKKQGIEFSDVLTSPLWLAHSWFDVTINLAAYLPFGLLLGLTLRARITSGWSLLLATLGGLALSTTMEYAQMYLPGRISSNLDILANTGGTLGGAILAISLAPHNWFALLAYWRQRLFHTGRAGDFGLALVTLWGVAQINPSFPMLGNVFISEVLASPFAPMPPPPFSWLECIAVALNLLMLGYLLITLLHVRRHAFLGLIALLCAVSLSKFIAAALLLKSWALLLWLNSSAVLGIIFGMFLVAVTSWMPRRALWWCAAGAAMTYLGLTQGLLESGTPSTAMPLYHWRYGHLLNYNGLSQTILLAFPLLLLGYLWRIRER